MHRRSILALFLSVLFLAALLAGCGSGPMETQPDDAPVRDMTEAEGTQRSPEQGGTKAPAVTDAETVRDVVVNTAFGDLHYQEQWEEFIRTEQVADENYITVSFMAEINGSLYALFDVTIGEGEDEPVGQLTDANGTVRDVFVTVEEIVFSSDMTEDLYNQLCAMQEDINYVINNLK